jgi:hypothetical protein
MAESQFPGAECAEVAQEPRTLLVLELVDGVAALLSASLTRQAVAASL